MQKVFPCGSGKWSLSKEQNYRREKAVKIDSIMRCWMLSRLPCGPLQYPVTHTLMSLPLGPTAINATINVLFVSFEYSIINSFSHFISRTLVLNKNSSKLYLENWSFNMILKSNVIEGTEFKSPIYNLLGSSHELYEDLFDSPDVIFILNSNTKSLICWFKSLSKS